LMLMAPLLTMPLFTPLVRMPIPVCTENLNTGVVVMKSAQDGA
jgi:hypothetical protein